MKQVESLIAHQMGNQNTTDCTYVYKEELDGLSFKSVKYTKKPAREVCCLAASTFEKLKVRHIKMLEGLIDELNRNGRILQKTLTKVTTKIMTEVWNEEGALGKMLSCNTGLTESIGREMLVLFESVITEPIYSDNVPRKTPRYTRTCLTNAIQPQYDLTENDGCFETVISTYTSPTSFTPEMENLIKDATDLGISTEDYNLKNFATERSLSAVLRKLIKAKKTKKEFIEKFNNKLLGVLNHLPEDNGVAKNKFKYSFSKIYEIASKNKNARSTVLNHFNTPNYSRISPKFQQRSYSLTEGDESRDFGKTSFSFRNSKNVNFKNKMMNCMVVACPPAPTGRKNFSVAPSFGKFLNGKSSPNFMRNDNDLFEKFRKRVDDKITNSLLTEQRSYFRLGDANLDDEFSEFHDKDQSNSKLKFKKVRWLDIPERSSFSSTTFWSTEDMNTALVSSAESSFSALTLYCPKSILFAWLFCCINILRNIWRWITRCDKVWKKAMLQGVIHSTVFSVFIWIGYGVYLRTTDIADLLRKFDAALKGTLSTPPPPRNQYWFFNEE